MNELQLQVLIDPDLGSEIKGAVAFGDFESDDDAAAIYRVEDAHVFYRDLIFGRPFPLVLVTRKVESLGILLGITLFLHRDLAIHPAMPGLFAAVNLADFHGTAGLAHIDRDLSRFFKFLYRFMGTSRNKKEQQEAITAAVGWFRGYILEGSLPALPAEKEPPRVLDQGTNGFVVASVAESSDLVIGWEELYRSGYLRGVLMRSMGNDRWQILAAKKSAYLTFDLERAASALNEVESAMGEPAGWRTDGLWLLGPKDGTLILPTDLLKVLLRV